MSPIQITVDFWADPESPGKSAAYVADHELLPRLRSEIRAHVDLFTFEVAGGPRRPLSSETHHQLRVVLKTAQEVEEQRGLLQAAKKELDEAIRRHVEDQLQLRACAEIIAELRKPWYRKLFCRIALLFRKTEVTSNC